MGSLVVSFIAAPFILAISRLLVIQYRVLFLAKIERWKVIEVLKGNRVYQIYQGMGG